MIECRDKDGFDVNWPEESKENLFYRLWKSEENKRQWRPMQTAPRDGSTILVWDAVSGCPQSAWFKGTFDNLWVRYGDREVLKPIGWMPLPEPPEVESE